MAKPSLVLKIGLERRIGYGSTSSVSRFATMASPVSLRSKSVPSNSELRRGFAASNVSQSDLLSRWHDDFEETLVGAQQQGYQKDTIDPQLRSP